MGAYLIWIWGATPHTILRLQRDSCSKHMEIEMEDMQSRQVRQRVDTRLDIGEYSMAQDPRVAHPYLQPLAQAGIDHSGYMVMRDPRPPYVNAAALEGNVRPPAPPPPRDESNVLPFEGQSRSPSPGPTRLSRPPSPPSPPSPVNNNAQNPPI